MTHTLLIFIVLVSLLLITYNMHLRMRALIYRHTHTHTHTHTIIYRHAHKSETKGGGMRHSFPLSLTGVELQIEADRHKGGQREKGGWYGVRGTGKPG
jgi:hypothetical protein